MGVSPADVARADRVLWRAERITLEEAERVANAYPPPPSDPPALRLAHARAAGTLAGHGFKYEGDALSERIDEAAMVACNTPVAAMDFIHNFGPEAPLISAIHRAWLASLLGDRLAGEDRDLLWGPWSVVPEEPASDRFGPRTEECEAFILGAEHVSAADADGLGRLWDKPAYDHAYELLRSIPSLRERRYNAAGGLACDAVKRALTGQDNGFAPLGLDHSWRHAAYLTGNAAVAECVRAIANPELIDSLEGPWLAVMARVDHP